MPELPEVETVRRDLTGLVLNQKISKVEILRSKAVLGRGKQIKDALVGNSWKKIERKGKLLIFRLAAGQQSLLAHLKMTGQFVFQKRGQRVGGGHGFPSLEEKLPNRHTQVVFTFSDHAKLFFNDLRRFGYLKIVDPQEAEKDLARFGVGPLEKEFTKKVFSDLVQKKKIKIKALLMDQKLISGIGNIYADEICFCARVRPTRPTPALTSAEISRLYFCAQSILKKAIHYRGTTFSDYRDGQGKKGGYSKLLKVYGRVGQPCLRCQKSKIKKIRQGGRGTHFCERCQR